MENKKEIKVDEVKPEQDTDIKESAKDEPQEDETKQNALKSIKELISDDEPKRPNISLREILGGDILTTQALRNQIWLIVLIVAITIIYISNRYSSQQELIEIDKLNTELKDAKYKALSSSSRLTERCRESHVLEILKTNKDSVLHIADQPPYIIKTSE
jgi:hypothetical protein